MEPAAANPPATAAPTPSPASPASSRRTGGLGGGGFGGGNRIVAPGTYRVVLTVDGQAFTQTLRVDADPNLPPGQVMVEEEANADEKEEARRRQASDDRFID
jgi:hypothetical protein